MFGLIDREWELLREWKMDTNEKRNGGTNAWAGDGGIEHRGISSMLVNVLDALNLYRIKDTNEEFPVLPSQ